MNCRPHFSPRKLRPIHGALLLLGLFAVSSCRPLSDRQIAGMVLTVEGEGRLSRDAKTTGLTKSQHFRSGDGIAILANSRAELMILPGVLIELAGESEIEIQELNLERDGDETIQPMTARKAHIRLTRGRLIATVSLAPTESFLTVDTPAGSLTAGPDRTFMLKVNRAQTWVMSVRGETTFRAPGRTQDHKIAAGYFVNLPLLPAAPPQRAANAGPEMQAQVVAILEVEKRLLLLLRQEGSAFRPW
jgi:hypothetical protein